ncbi:MAG: glycoside hydrolase, family 24 [Rhodoferax sp.]|nr:glycoside hydrolase, family 24 [Rhodoferax sp.]
MADPRTLARVGAAAVAAIALAGPLVGMFEGRVFHTYPDVVHGWKVPTACDGHTGPELRRGQRFTSAECDEMRAVDLRLTFDQLAPCMDLALPPNELAAYLSLAFNVGAGAVCRSSIPVKIAAGNRAAACATITQFYLAGGLDCRDPANNCMGIPRRRAAERDLCETP